MTYAFLIAYIVIIIGLIVLIRKPNKTHDSKIILLSLEVVLVMISLLLFKYFSNRTNQLDTTFSIAFTAILSAMFIATMLQILLYDPKKHKKKKKTNKRKKSKK